MSPQYTAEIFHPSSSVHNTRRATQKLDIPFRKSCIGQKTLSYIGPKIWNNLPAQIKLSKSVNTFKHDIKKSFFDDLQKQNDDIFFYLLDTAFQTCYMLRTCMMFYMSVPPPFCCLFSQRDHNENKVYPDLYYAIPATVS